MQNASKKSSLKNKLVVSFFLIILIFGIGISLVIQTALRQGLVTEGLEETVIDNIVKNFTTNSLGLIMVVAFLALLIGFFLSKYITQPIEKLTKIINEIINTGKFNIQIDSNLAQSDDEIGQLAIAFNKLLAKLKEFYGSLEKKVEEKTQELVKAKSSLEESEKRFKDVTNNALEWIWEVDADGLYTYTSPIVEKILGYKPEEIIGKKHFYDFFHSEDKEALKEGTLKAFAKKQSFQEFINRNIHKSGKIVWLSTGGVPILDKRGNLLGYRGADIDITERKLSEENLRKTTKDLEEKVEELERFERATMGRELKIIELKKEIEELKKLK